MGTSIGKVGFFGEANQKLWCLTHIETLRYANILAATRYDCLNFQLQFLTL